MGNGCHSIIISEPDWILLNPIYNNLEGFGLWIALNRTC